MNWEKQAEQFESFVYDWFIKTYGIAITHYHTREEQFTKGENRQGFEIKNDQSYCQTGNLFISVLRKSKDGTPYNSGIFKQDNRWLYIIGDKNEFFVFTCKQLQNYYLHYKPELKKGFVTSSGRTEYGFLLSKKDADKIAAIKHTTQLEMKL